MKKFLLSLAVLVGLSAFIFAATADNTADFNTFNNGKANTAYSTYTTTSGWKATNSAITDVDGDLAATLNGKTSAVGTLTSPTLTGGIGTLSFSYTNTFSETKGVSVKIDIKQNGNIVKSQTLTNEYVTQNNVYSFTSQAFNVEGNFVIEITNLSPSNNSSSNKDRVSIWNVSWTSYSGDSTGGETPTLQPAGLKFSVETATATIGQTFTAPTLSKTTTAAVTYTSSNTTVATVDPSSGIVTLVAAGKTTITATAAANETYSEGTASYELTVQEASSSTPGEAGEVTFDFTTNSYGLPNDGNTYVTTPVTFSEGAVSMTLNGDQAQAWRYWSDGLREYYGKKPSFTVSVPAGKITEITWTTKANTVKFTDVAQNGSAITSWKGNAESVTLYGYVSTGNAAVLTVTVKYTGGTVSNVKAPTVSCSNNVVTMTAEEGAEIYYTTNESEPSNQSNKYTDPITISQTTTFKAIAYVGDEKSSVTTYTASYVGMYEGFQALMNQGANTEGTVAGPMTAIYQNGQYLYVIDKQEYPMLIYGSINQTLNNGDQIENIKGKYSPYNGLPEITNPVLGNITTNGTPIAPNVISCNAVKETALNSYVQFNNVSIDADKNMTDASGTVVLYSRFTGVNFPTDYTKKYNVQGFTSIFNGTYQVYPTKFEEVVIEVEQVAMPVINPNGGEVAAGTEVTITCATPDAKIYYTTNGDTPSAASNLYNTPIVISEAQTIKAIAIKAECLDSPIATAEFTILDPNKKSATFNFTEPSSLGDYPDEGVANQEFDVTDVTFTAGVISLTSYAEEGASSKPRLFYGSGNSAGWTYRFYNQNSFTIAAAKGYIISSIEFNGTNLGNKSITCDPAGLNGSGSNWTWTPAEGVENVTSVTIEKTETGNNPAISTITVNYTAVEVIPVESISFGTPTLVEPSFTNDMPETPVLTLGEKLRVPVTFTPPEATNVADIDWTVTGATGITFTPDAEGNYIIDTTNATITSSPAIVTITGTIGNVTEEYEFTAKNVLAGDANANGRVTVADVVTTANVAAALLGGDTTEEAGVASFCFPNADVVKTTDDGKVDVNDVTAIVKIIIGENVGARAAKTNGGYFETNDQLVADNFKAVQGKETAIAVTLDNSRNYNALQATVVIPEGMTVVGVTKGERAAAHDLVYHIGDGKVGIILYSLANDTFAAGNDALFNLIVVASEDCDNLEIENIVATDASNGYGLSFDGGRNITGTTGIDGIDADEPGTRYYNLNGIEIARPDKGVYIRVNANGEAVKVVK